MFKNIKEVFNKFKPLNLTKSLDVTHRTPLTNSVNSGVNAVEFEVPENAQYNPRIPDLIFGKVES
jgi:hypothetical protein